MINAQPTTNKVYTKKFNIILEMIVFIIIFSLNFFVKNLLDWIFASPESMNSEPNYVLFIIMGTLYGIHYMIFFIVPINFIVVFFKFIKLKNKRRELVEFIAFFIIGKNKFLNYIIIFKNEIKQYIKEQNQQNNQ